MVVTAGSLSTFFLSNIVFLRYTFLSISILHARLVHVFFSLRKRLKWNWSRFQIHSKSHEISLFFTRWNIITFDTIRKNFNRYPNELRKRIEICPLTKLFRSSNMRQGQSHRHDSNQRSENTQHRRSFVSCNVNEITKLSKCSDERVQHPASKQWHGITRNIRSTFPSGEPVAR